MKNNKPPPPPTHIVKTTPHALYLPQESKIALLKNLGSIIARVDAAHELHDMLDGRLELSNLTSVLDHSIEAVKVLGEDLIKCRMMAHETENKLLLRISRATASIDNKTERRELLKAAGIPGQKALEIERLGLIKEAELERIHAAARHTGYPVSSRTLSEFGQLPIPERREAFKVSIGDRINGPLPIQQAIHRVREKNLPQQSETTNDLSLPYVELQTLTRKGVPLSSALARASLALATQIKNGARTVDARKHLDDTYQELLSWNKLVASAMKRIAHD